ncbi:Nudix hydrolase [Actinidia chinensis var. chinensis]|uniref:Nudix hydrolase n=1 Tax=Actinidia chinensis var. chinensis TaxID=1590841 RepID=A0A2R6RY81_ACTCC|nr:Nudix hydrolase [Actinidia chinensis var. chinensis]
MGNDETVKEAALRDALEEAGVRGDLLHFLGYYKFTSKTLQDESSPEGLFKAARYALLVKDVLQSWTEQRTWLTIPEALEEGFSKWHADGLTSTIKDD